MDERVFKINSKFSDKEYTAFQQYTAKKVLVPICIVCSLIFLALGIIRLFDDIYLGVAFIVISVIFPFIYLKAYNREINKKKYKSAMVGDDVNNLMEFTEDGFTEKTYRGEEQVGVTSLKYSDLFKVVDYKDYLFVYISKVQAFIVDKNGFVVGDVDSFKQFLTEKGVKLK